MATKLKNYFPMIRERKEVLAEIRKRQTLQNQFDAWNTPKQEMFLDFCTGVRGLKLLYDGFFREITVTICGSGMRIYCAFRENMIQE